MRKTDSNFCTRQIKLLRYKQKKNQYLLIARIRSRKTQENHQSAKLMTLQKNFFARHRS